MADYTKFAKTQLEAMGRPHGFKCSWCPQSVIESGEHACWLKGLEDILYDDIESGRVSGPLGSTKQFVCNQDSQGNILSGRCN